MLSTEVLHKESVQINVIIPEHLLIAIVNTQRKQEHKHSLPLSFLLTTLTLSAMRKKKKNSGSTCVYKQHTFIYFVSVIYSKALHRRNAQLEKITLCD